MMFIFILDTKYFKLTLEDFCKFLEGLEIGAMVKLKDGASSFAPKTHMSMLP